MLEKVDGGYRFFVELMRRWVAEHRPLERVKDELEPFPGVSLADDLYRAAQGFYQAGKNEQGLRTDQNGWIEVTTDGKQMWVKVERK